MTSDVESGKNEGDGAVQHVPPATEYDFDTRQVLCTMSGSSDKGAGATHPDRSFWRHAAWSPDGSHLLAQSDDHHLDLFQLRFNTPPHNGARLEYVLSVRAPTTLLAYAWYPFARCDEPATWCFVMSARDVPVRLVDAYEGKTRATYGIVDHVERFIGPQAIAFSLDGQRLYCAHGTSLSTFALAHPGINTHTRLQLTPSHRATRKGKAAAGQRGTISCIAVSSDRTIGSEQELVAIGTFAGTVGVYRTDTASTTGEEACVLGWRETQAHGVVQLSFHPTTPYILFVASRRGGDVRAYDLRYVGTRRSFTHAPSDVALVATFSHTPESGEDEPATQQRLFFDVDSTGRFLLAGDASGQIRAWNIFTSEEGPSDDQQGASFGRILKSGEAPQRTATHSWQGADDTIACVALHPHLPLLLIASGSRRWPDDERASEGVEEDDSDITSSSVSVDVDEDKTPRFSGSYSVRDGSLRLCRIATASLQVAEPPS